MASQKFSERPITASKAGGYIPINLPLGGGVYETKMISVANLLAGIGGEGISFLNQNGAFVQEFAAETYITSITVKVLTGTPTLMIGTTLGGLDVLSDGDGNALDITLPLQRINLDYYIDTTKDLYFTVASGSVNIRVDYINIPV